MSKEDAMSERYGGWSQTQSNVEFYPADPRVEEIRLEDIAHGLAIECRWGGQSKYPVPVAQHVVWTSKVVEMLNGSLLDQFVALHHDDAEAYIGDIKSPLKRMWEFEFIRAIEHRLNLCIFEALGVPQGYPFSAMVKHADTVMLVTEAEQVMPPHPWYLADCYPDAAPIKVVEISWRRAKAHYLMRHYELIARANKQGSWT